MTGLHPLRTLALGWALRRAERLGLRERREAKRICQTLGCWHKPHLHAEDGCRFWHADTGRTCACSGWRNA